MFVVSDKQRTLLSQIHRFKKGHHGRCVSFEDWVQLRFKFIVEGHRSGMKHLNATRLAYVPVHLDWILLPFLGWLPVLSMPLSVHSPYQFLKTMTRALILRAFFQTVSLILLHLVRGIFFRGNPKLTRLWPLMAIPACTSAREGKRFSINITKTLGIEHWKTKHFVWLARIEKRYDRCNQTQVERCCLNPQVLETLLVLPSQLPRVYLIHDLFTSREP